MPSSGLLQTFTPIWQVHKCAQMHKRNKSFRKRTFKILRCCYCWFRCRRHYQDTHKEQTHSVSLKHGKKNNENIDQVCIPKHRPWVLSHVCFTDMCAAQALDEGLWTLSWHKSHEDQHSIFPGGLCTLEPSAEATLTLKFNIFGSGCTFIILSADEMSTFLTLCENWMLSVRQKDDKTHDVTTLLD